MLLHTVNKSPFERNSFDTCVGLAKGGSSVLLFEDGVYAAMKGAATEGKVKDAMGADVKVYALGPDLKARGLSESNVVDGVSIVDYAGFVQLAADSHAVQSWV